MAQTRTRSTDQSAYPNRGEIYLTTFDPALGHEIRKTRPALVIQNDITNQYGSTTIVAAITSKVNSPPYPNEVILHPGQSGLETLSTVRLDQLRTVDRRRLIKRLGRVDYATMRGVDQAIKISLGLVSL